VPGAVPTGWGSGGIAPPLSPPSRSPSSPAAGTMGVHGAAKPSSAPEMHWSSIIQLRSEDGDLGEQLGNAGGGSPRPQGEARPGSGEGSTRDRPGQAVEAPVRWRRVEERDLEQDSGAAEEPTELLAGRAAAGVSSAASKAG